MSPHDRQGAIRLGRTIEVTARCFEAAERKTQENVRNVQPDATEEEITTTFERELTTSVQASNKNGEIEDAFRQDVTDSIPAINNEGLRRIAEGAIIRVAWHDRHVEAKTAADFGITFTRPIVRFFPSMEGDGSGRVQVDTNWRSGVLVQAKKKAPAKKWRGMSETQEAVFPKFRPHGLFVLYRLPDSRTLSALGWQSCRRRRLSTVRDWFLKDSFPSLLTSRDVIEQLAEGRIGTDSERIISKSVIPRCKRILVVSISWQDPDRRDFEVYVQTEPDQEQRLRIRLSY